MTTQTILQCRCDTCGTTKDVKPTSKGHPRPPRGWKHVGDAYWCAACWKEQYAIRAITIPVTGPIDIEWSELRERMRESFALSTELANWCVRRLMLNDVDRTRAMEKLPPMPKLYLYGEAKAGFHRWHEMPATTANAILQQAEAKWRAKRYEMLWLNADRPPRYTYPQPWPVTNQNWKFVATNQDGRLAVSVCLAGARVSLLLRGGREYGRQLAGLRHLQANPHLCGELSLYEIRSHEGDHRNGDSGRKNGDGAKFQSRLMCKLVGWFPRQRNGRSGELPVRSTSDALLVALDVDGDRVWTYHADHSRRMIAAHNRHLERLQRLSDDRKAERRKPRRESQDYREMLAQRSKKDGNRMTTLCHEVSASVVNFAKRRNYVVVKYDDSDHSFAPQFPWHKLRTMVEQKCRREGMTFTHCGSSGSETQK